MSKLIVFIFKGIMLFSCNPLVKMEANIINLTSASLSLNFVSSDSVYRKILKISPDQTVLFDIYHGYGT